MPNNGSSSANLKPEALNALRDLVYTDVIEALPWASINQANQFMANLALPKKAIGRLLNLRVSREIGGTPYHGIPCEQLLRDLEEKYGDRITLVAGFYRNGRGRLCWTIPEGCALFAYRSRLGFYNGILCQPLYALDKFWLLTSSKFGGPKALRLSDHDAALFEAGLVTYPARSPRASFVRQEART